MRSHKVVTTALLLALVLVAVAAMTASAAGPLPQTGTTAAITPIQATFVGQVTFHASPKAATLNNNSPAIVNNYLNRTIPGKVAVPTPKPPVLPLPTLPGTSFIASNPGLRAAMGINAHDQRYTHGYNVEPPDQGLCAGNGWVVEANNLVIKVFRADLSNYSADMVLEHFFGNLMAFAGEGGDYTVQGDPRCYWDADTQRWFVTQLNLDLSASTSRVEIMVSNTPDPNGVWNKYQFDTTNGTGSTPGHPGCPCLGDQPTLGASRDAFFITTNEYSIAGFEFNGAQVYGLDKWGMANHLLAVSINGFALNAGNVPNPDGSCAGGLTYICWYSVQMASSPNAVYDNTGNGTAYALSALDFFNLHDKRIALWAFTGLNSIHAAFPAPISVAYYVKVLGSEVYGLPPSDGGPNAVKQKPGPTPLYDVVYANGAAHPGPIDAGDDRMQNTVYAHGVIWGALTTGVIVNSETLAGIAYFAVKPSWLAGPALNATMVGQGYVAAKHEDVMYPGTGISPTGNGAIGFTLVGPDYWPTAAYVKVSQVYAFGGDIAFMSALAPGFGNGPIHIANLGQSPQDGFTEYQYWPTSDWRPRWGDYGYAVWYNGFIYFSNEYIQFPNCSDAVFTVDRSCNGTRGTQSNWGTSLDRVTTP